MNQQQNTYIYLWKEKLHEFSEIYNKHLIEMLKAAVIILKIQQKWPRKWGKNKTLSYCSYRLSISDLKCSKLPSAEVALHMENYILALTVQM